MSELKGKVALVTGAGGGMGRHVALELARRGAHVLVHARSEARAAATVEQAIRGGGSAEPLAADLASLAAVREMAAQAANKHAAMHVLVNNAGLWPAGRELTPEGHEATWAVNVLAPYVLTQALMEPLRAGNARVVNVASREHYAGRIKWDDVQHERGFAPRHAYRQSKLALVMQTLELARREPALRANSVHPGVIATELFRNLPWIVGLCIGAFCPSPESGARAIWRLALEGEAGDASGRFFYRFRERAPHAHALDGAARERLWELLARQVA